MFGSAGTETSTQISSGIKAGSVKETSKLDVAPRQKLEFPVGMREGDGMSPQSNIFPVAQFWATENKAASMSIENSNSLSIPVGFRVRYFDVPAGIQVRLQSVLTH